MLAFYMYPIECQIFNFVLPDCTFHLFSVKFNPQSSESIGNIQSFCQFSAKSSKASTSSDNFTERIEQKIFHAEIVVDADKVKREESHYQPIPIINDFKDTNGNDCMKQAIQDNYNRIKEDVKQIVKDELERIAADENLKHLIQKA